MNLRNFFLLTAIATLLWSCEKDLDTPPVRTLPTGEVLTVAELRGLYTGTARRFGGDSSVYAVVTADEANGNLYKNIYIQDHTGAIVMRLINSGGLYQGDSIRIYLPGTILSSYAGMLQLDSVDVDNNVVKQATLVQKEPEVVTIAQITPAMQGRLVRINDVEFPVSEVGQTYADAAGQQTINRTLTDCLSSVIVRTSGYANFAGQTLPYGNGSFIGVVGQFNSDMQLFIRNVNEVQLFDVDARCAPLPTLCSPGTSVNQDFAGATANIDLNLTCWNNQPQVGSRYWRGYSVGGDLCAQATAFGSSNASDVAWMITPPTTYTPGMGLSFRTQRGFGVASHDPFGLFISTNYNIANLGSANWVAVPSTYATPSTADQVWVNSGTIDLSTVLPAGYTGSFVVGFRYTGSDPNGNTTNFRVDDVVIQ
ncbi:MAG: choice-of-anchor J domain-containing protein [Flavobacteriales bacterium]|nr:choice-of-anchor J domain-containing protein [Flavobacteriales bacterium]